MQALLLVVEHGGPPSCARIGIIRALNRGYVRELNTSRKDHHWGPRKLGAESMTEARKARIVSNKE